MKTLGVTADWYESQQKFDIKKKKKSNDIRVKNELMLTNEEIKLRRKAMLKELYCYEMQL